ncbi:MAG: hypothetical protein ACRDIB_09650 [Ardenticatenaceae bacterium]
MCQLELYIMQDCPTCRTAQRVAWAAARRFPSLALSIIDLDAPNVIIPAEVFSAPTFRLNGRVVSLGTPEWTSLSAAIRRALDQPT